MITICTFYNTLYPCTKKVNTIGIPVVRAANYYPSTSRHLMMTMASLGAFLFPTVSSATVRFFVLGNSKTCATSVCLSLYSFRLVQF